MGVQVNIRNIELVNNPAKYDDEYHFRIKFEAISALAEGKHLLQNFSITLPLSVLIRYRPRVEARLCRIGDIRRL